MPDIVTGQVVVPDLEDLDTASAEDALAFEKLLVAYGTSVYSDTITTVGNVVSQDPPADTDVDPQTVVTLILSLGPDPNTEENKQTIPYLIGRTQAAARMRIEALYLIVEVIPSDTGDSEGSVVSQDPAFMARVSRGTTVQITMGGPLNFSRSTRRQGLPTYGAPDRRP